MEDQNIISQSEATKLLLKDIAKEAYREYGVALKLDKAARRIIRIREMEKNLSNTTNSLGVKHDKHHKPTT